MIDVVQPDTDDLPRVRQRRQELHRFRVDRCAARQRSGDQRKIGVAADELLKTAGIPAFILEQASEASA
jgi:hypothetical protein